MQRSGIHKQLGGARIRVEVMVPVVAACCEVIVHGAYRNPRAIGGTSDTVVGPLDPEVPCTLYLF
jgi:hypothetical protein